MTDISQIFFEYQDGTGDYFSDMFEYRTPIGLGGFGFVVAALNKETGEEIAIKLLRIDKVPKVVVDLFKKEADILKSLHEEYNLSQSRSTDSKNSSRIFTPPKNIIGFRFFKEFSNYLLLGMELWIGGNLHDYIKEQRKIQDKSQEKYEEEWSVIVKNILEGLDYIHDRFEVIHRDIKPANILFLRKNNLESIKIWDFGFANEVGVGFFDQNEDNVGTLIYQAPEQMKSSSYGKKVDIWAIGMIMYELLTKGGHPFLGGDFYNKLDMEVVEYKRKMMNLIKDDKILKKNTQFSSLAFKMMENLLNVAPNYRYSASRALKHPWITRDLEAKIPMSMYEEIELSMRAYDKLKLATRVAYAMTMISHKVLKKDLVKEIG